MQAQDRATRTSRCGRGSTHSTRTSSRSSWPAGGRCGSRCFAAPSTWSPPGLPGPAAGAAGGARPRFSGSAFARSLEGVDVERCCSARASCSTTSRAAPASSAGCWPPTGPAPTPRRCRSRPATSCRWCRCRRGASSGRAPGPATRTPRRSSAGRSGRTPRPTSRAALPAGVRAGERGRRPPLVAAAGPAAGLRAAAAAAADVRRRAGPRAASTCPTACWSTRRSRRRSGSCRSSTTSRCPTRIEAGCCRPTGRPRRAQHRGVPGRRDGRRHLEARAREGRRRAAGAPARTAPPVRRARRRGGGRAPAGLPGAERRDSKRGGLVSRIRGDELVALGLPQGPAFGVALNALPAR